jgi:ankyrin repeat protein
MSDLALGERALEVVRAGFACARGGDADGLRALLDLGLPPDVRNEKGDSLLMLASYHGHAAAVRLLLERGADPDLASDRGQTPLAGAAFKGDAGTAALLLDGGAAVDGAAGPDGRTPLMFAAMFDRLEVLALLLARGAAPDRRDAGGTTARALALAMGAHRTAERLADAIEQTSAA